MKKKLKIAITGGIGGGKTSFSKILIHKGYTVLSADDFAKEVMVKDENLKESIIKNFGEKSYRNGNLNNKYLAEKVFSDPAMVKKINKLVHPKVISGLEKLMKDHLKKENVIFVEAALIYEAKMEMMFDLVVVITADEEIRKKRLALKGISKSEFEKRSSSQIPDDKKKKKADFVFENNSGPDELKQKAELFLRIIDAYALIA